MVRGLKRLWCAALALLLTVGMVVAMPGAALAAGSVALDPGYLELPVGTGCVLDAQPSPEGAKLKWVSSDPSVVSVDEAGAVAALSEGEAQITVSLANDPAVSAVCTVQATKDGHIYIWNRRPQEASVTLGPAPEALDDQIRPDGRPGQRPPEPEPDPEPLTPEQVQQIEEQAPIEVEVPRDEEGQVEKPAPKPSVREARRKEYVWTITVKDTCHSELASPEAAQSFSAVMRLDFTAQKDGGASPLGRYKGTATLRDTPDTSRWVSNTEAITGDAASMVMAWEAPFDSVEFNIVRQPPDPESKITHEYFMGYGGFSTTWTPRITASYGSIGDMGGALKEVHWTENLYIMVYIYGDHFAHVVFRRKGIVSDCNFSGQLSKRVKMGAGKKK